MGKVKTKPKVYSTAANSKLIQKSKESKLKEKRENLLRKINVNQKSKAKISKKKKVIKHKKAEKKKIAKILPAAEDFSAIKYALLNLDDSLCNLKWM